MSNKSLNTDNDAGHQVSSSHSPRRYLRNQQVKCLIRPAVEQDNSTIFSEETCLPSSQFSLSDSNYTNELQPRSTTHQHSFYSGLPVKIASTADLIHAPSCSTFVSNRSDEPELFPQDVKSAIVTRSGSMDCRYQMMDEEEEEYKFENIGTGRNWYTEQAKYLISAIGDRNRDSEVTTEVTPEAHDEDVNPQPEIRSDSTCDLSMGWTTGHHCCLHEDRIPFRSCTNNSHGDDVNGSINIKKNESVVVRRALDKDSFSGWAVTPSSPSVDAEACVADGDDAVVGGHDGENPNAPVAHSTFEDPWEMISLSTSSKQDWCVGAERRLPKRSPPVVNIPHPLPQQHLMDHLLQASLSHHPIDATNHLGVHPYHERTVGTEHGVERTSCQSHQENTHQTVAAARLSLSQDPLLSSPVELEEGAAVSTRDELLTTVEGIAAQAEEIVGSFLRRLHFDFHDEFPGTRSFLQHLNILRLQSQQSSCHPHQTPPLSSVVVSPPTSVQRIEQTESQDLSNNEEDDYQYSVSFPPLPYRPVADASRDGEDEASTDTIRSTATTVMNLNDLLLRRSRRTFNDGRIGCLHVSTQTTGTFSGPTSGHDHLRLLALRQLHSQVHSRQSVIDRSSDPVSGDYLQLLSRLPNLSDGNRPPQNFVGITASYPYTGVIHHLPVRVDRKRILEQLKDDLHKSIVSKIDHSSKFADDVYEYRFVILPRYHPWFVVDIDEDLREPLMDEEEWRLLGIGHTRGWEHYGYSRHESNVFLFRRALGTDPKTGRVDGKHVMKVCERTKLLDHLNRELEASRKSTAQFAPGPTSFRRNSGKHDMRKGLLQGEPSPSTNGTDSLRSAAPLVSTVPGFGSFQGGSTVDSVSLIEPQPLAGGGGERITANTLTARNLAGVIRTGNVFPQPPNPFFDLPYNHNEDEGSDSDEGLWQIDDDSVCTDRLLYRGDEESMDCDDAVLSTMTHEQFVNDVDWLYASLHMPLYPAS